MYNIGTYCIKLQTKKGLVHSAVHYRYRVDLGHRVGHYNECVKFEYNDIGIIVY